MSDLTLKQYNSQLKKCRDLFIKKTKDYGTAWRILRTSSLTDQLYIKAKRIRSIEEKGEQKVEDGVENEFIGLVNYSIMALIQLDMSDHEEIELEESRAADLYDVYSFKTRDLMMDKNHDYGEAWRDMSQESFVDLILAKLLRIKQILANDGKTLVSEGIASNFLDILNYAAFGLILIAEGKHGQ